MFWTIVVDGKARHVSFWKWLAYMNQQKLERIEKKVDFITKNKKEKPMYIKIDSKISPEELFQATKPLMDLLARKGNPMMIVQVTDKRVDLYEAVCGKPIEE